ncbi:MAG: chromosomal replication initiator protein DnaA [Acholeplasmatales bacterium]|nr:chromosomal replication initiator protein DnaA [Acholeplasmatales bacterium]
MQNYQELWNDVKSVLKDKLSEETFNNTFGEVKKVYKEENGTLYIIVPSVYIKATINTVHYKNISNIIDELSTKKLRAKFVLEDEVKEDNKIITNKPALIINNLNQNFTFESFVLGASNRAAYLAASRVAENPGSAFKSSFNPLYIFGGVGLGKTHLMQAIGNYIQDTNENFKILYIQAYDYYTEYSKASRDKNWDAFEEKYSNIDVLLIDDIQMLEGKKETQTQFFQLFNDMILNGKQVVVTSDRPADKLNNFMDRLYTRFQDGDIENINQPDLPQRINILKRKVAEQTTKNVPDDVLNFIAETFTNNVRELQGALTRVLNYSEFFNQDINLEMAKESLDVLIKANKANSDNDYQNCLSVIANWYNISVADILGASRANKVVLPRHIAMYILKTKYELSYSKIGSILNGRDHSTIINGCNKIENDLKNNQELIVKSVEAILKKL